MACGYFKYSLGNKNINKEYSSNKIPLVMMAKKANINLIVLFLHDFGRPESKTFHFSPNQLMIGYLKIKRNNNQVTVA